MVVTDTADHLAEAIAQKKKISQSMRKDLEVLENCLEQENCFKNESIKKTGERRLQISAEKLKPFMTLAFFDLLKRCYDLLVERYPTNQTSIAKTASLIVAEITNARFENASRKKGL